MGLPDKQLNTAPPKKRPQAPTTGHFQKSALWWTHSLKVLAAVILHPYLA